MLPLAIMGAISGVAGTFNPIPQESWGEAQNCLRIVYENDSPFGRDRDYTHGTRIDYAKAVSTASELELGWGVSLTQNMYTPVHHGTHAIPGEHPYAGSLAVGGAFFVRCQEGSPWGALLELQVGAIGKPSLAHEMQDAVHEIGHMEKWHGWKDQVPSEAMFQLSATNARKINCLSKSYGYWETEAQVYGRYDLGTVLISLGSGVGFRVGHNLPNSMPVYGNRPSNYGIGLVQKGDGMTGYDPGSISYYFTANLFVEYVARDFSIDGGMFHHFDRTCSRKPWQVEAQLGVGATYHGIDYYMGAILHSRTYRTQDINPVYGTFSISWRW